MVEPVEPASAGIGDSTGDTAAPAFALKEVTLDLFVANSLTHRLEPVVGDLWLMSVDEWDPSNRNDEEEYFAEVVRKASAEEKVTDGADGTTQFVVQDLEEATGPEVVPSVKRRIFNVTPLMFL